MEHLNASPVTSDKIRVWTDHDPVLAKVKVWVQTGWPDDRTTTDQDFRPYRRRQNELSVEDGCVLWGSRVVVPTKGRERVMEILHDAHLGIARMKRFARSYVWWPGIDQQLEDCVKTCNTCQQNQKSPPTFRVHIDYAGPFLGKMFLLIIDAHSKWMEVHMTTSATSLITISLLRKTFAALGLPDVVVSDNASNFTSEEFEDFLKSNGVKHVRTPPYHPASNGLAERAVQTFKEGMKKLKDETLGTKLARFLFKYQITPQTTTGISPAELIYGRPLRSHLDAVRPDVGRRTRVAQERQKTNHDQHARNREFHTSDKVYAKNFGPGEKWLYLEKFHE